MRQKGRWRQSYEGLCTSGREVRHHQTSGAEECSAQLSRKKAWSALGVRMGKCQLFEVAAGWDEMTPGDCLQALWFHRW